MRDAIHREGITMNKLFLTWFVGFGAGGSLASVYLTNQLMVFIPGETVRLECFISKDHDNYYSWFRLIAGQAPVCMLTLYSQSDTPTFFGEFNNNPRFTAKKNGTSFDLTILDAQQSDVGIYYCAARDYQFMIFGHGVFLMHEEGADSRIRHVVQQPVSESVQPGDSVTFNCTILTETCAGEHSVYWFRHGSGESRPGIIYTHGDRSDQCEKSPEAGSPTQSCVYHLPKRNLSLSDAGTYYCAVASCGEILFGNGTKLDIQEQDFPLTPTAIALVASNILCMIVIIVLTCGICKRRDTGPRGENESPPSTANQNQNSDVLNYAAVSFAPRSSSSSSRPRVKASRDAAVYSEVRYLQQE